jgi:hypothetical protein
VVNAWIIKNYMTTWIAFINARSVNSDFRSGGSLKKSGDYQASKKQQSVNNVLRNESLPHYYTMEEYIQKYKNDVDTLSNA